MGCQMFEFGPAQPRNRGGSGSDLLQRFEVRPTLAEKDHDTSGGKFQRRQAFRETSAGVEPVARASADSRDVINAINDESNLPVRLFCE